MRDQSHRSSVFTPAFLEQFGRRDEPVSGPEAEMAGPWKILEAGDSSFALLREWESTPEDPPTATFDRREHALLFSAIAPTAGRSPVYDVMTGEEEGGGYPVVCEGEEVGSLRWYDEKIAAALHVAGYLVRTPAALALLLEAAGPTALEAVGRLLWQRTMTAGEVE